MPSGPLTHGQLAQVRAVVHAELRAFAGWLDEQRRLGAEEAATAVRTAAVALENDRAPARDVVAFDAEERIRRGAADA